MVPRIFPWVPFPEPGAPTSSSVRYFIPSHFGIFMADLHGLYFDKRDHDFGGGVAALELEVHFVHGDAADPFGDVFAAHRLDDHDQILLGLTGHQAEEAGEFGLKKAAIEGELSPGEGLRLGL